MAASPTPHLIREYSTSMSASWAKYISRNAFSPLSWLVPSLSDRVSNTLHISYVLVHVWDDTQRQYSHDRPSNTADGGNNIFRNLTIKTPTHFITFCFLTRDGSTNCWSIIWRIVFLSRRVFVFLWFVPPSCSLCARPSTCDLFKATRVDVADQIVLGHCGDVLWNGSGLRGRLAGGGGRCICHGCAIYNICHLPLRHFLCATWNIVSHQWYRL